MTVECLDLADLLVIAEEITGIEVPVLMKMSRRLADSALHAPHAGYGAVDLYPDFVDQAAVLLVRLVKNHPLPDGNKRAGWVSMRMFVADWSWDPHPDIDDAERTVMAIASEEISTRQQPLPGCGSISTRPRRRVTTGRSRIPSSESTRRCTPGIDLQRLWRHLAGSGWPHFLTRGVHLGHGSVMRDSRGWTSYEC